MHHSTYDERGKMQRASVAMHSGARTCASCSRWASRLAMPETSEPTFPSRRMTGPPQGCGPVGQDLSCSHPSDSAHTVTRKRFCDQQTTWCEIAAGCLRLHLWHEASHSLAPAPSHAGHTAWTPVGDADELHPAVRLHCAWVTGSASRVRQRLAWLGTLPGLSLPPGARAMVTCIDMTGRGECGPVPLGPG